MSMAGHAADDSVARGPLAGLVVLDLSRILAAPWCTQLLADFGADVIKVERPVIGDDTRAWGPPWVDDRVAQSERMSAYFASTNRNKRSVTVDLSRNEGQEIVRRLAANADVLIENFKAGDLRRYGLHYASLRELNQALVYCSITGYGQDGPFADRAGYDVVFQAEAGLMSITGERDGLAGAGPQKVGIAVADIITGMYASSAILAALHHRRETGTGQYIDLALFDCAVAMGSTQAFNYLLTGIIPKRHGNGHPTLVPYQTFDTLDGPIVVAVGNDAQWGALCKLLNREDMAADPRFSTASGRIEHRSEVVGQVANALSAAAASHWLERMQQHGVPAGRVNNYKQVFDHPQAKHRGLAVTAVDGAGRQTPAPANPARFSSTPVSYRRSAPKLGEHTAEVLREFLGYTKDEIEALRHSGAV
jgi:crotonobetainyl-CoA:carnitine CoA-transferase CaiB-like acyl-CoA transferase